MWDVREKVKDDAEVFGQTTGKTGLLFTELGKTVREVGSGEY